MVKLATTLVLSVLVIQSTQVCKFGTKHKLTQATCSNLNVYPRWENHRPLEKLILRNATGFLDLTHLELQHLKYLLVDHSSIDSLTLGQFPNLVFVTFAKNSKFPDLTKEFFGPAAHINWLSLVSNNHSILPDSFDLLKNLTWLHIQNQKLQHLGPFLLKETVKLHELSMRNCQLQEVDGGAFDSTPELEILSMNFNEIRFFEIGTFKNLGRLKILELHHNKFVSFDFDQFRGLFSVEVLGLPSNLLRRVSKEALVTTFPNLKKLEVRKKDLTGRSSVKEFIKEIRKEGIDIIGTPHDCHALNCARN